jgi:large subunit ribosomal protein L7/L12
MNRKRLAMGTEHLKDKRTGRPPGARSRLPWIRGVRWAFRNIDKLDAKPPSAFAGLLLALGREHPERFAVCLALMDVVRLEELRRDQRKAHAADNASPAPGVAAGPAPAFVSAVSEPKTGLCAVILQGLREPTRKIEVIGALRTVAGLNLWGAKLLVESAPCPVRDGLTEEEASRTCDKLKAAGAAVWVQHAKPPSIANGSL